jgi:hypothetical protein
MNQLAALKLMSGTNRLKTEEPRSKMTHVLEDNVENVREIIYQIDI